jgi:glutathione synthase/RimK-type ligase-like ATP-grasp enzyme
MLKLLPYNANSRTARLLAEGLGCQRIRREGSKYIPKRGHTIINWGSGRHDNDNGTATYVNHYQRTARAGNKLRAFIRMKKVGNPFTPIYTNSMDAASDWLEDGHAVVERHTLRGHSGEGIVICNDLLEIGSALLYTMYQKKTHEYRVHVFPDGTHVLNQKRRRTEVADEDVNWQVRNFANGFTYCRDNVENNDAVVQAALRTIKDLQLDFGAVDVIYHAPSKKIVVLEVNTAPGLEGTLLGTYITKLGELYV